MKDLFGNITKAACFTAGRKHRFWLSRVWDKTKPEVAFIGLNPSTANEDENDNTITKVIKIAAHNGYGSVTMLNLYPCVTPYPQQIAELIDPAHTATNSKCLEEHTDDCDVVFCWGNFKEAQQIGKNVIEWFDKPLCIAQNKNGSPKHPLYCKDDSKLIPFDKSLTTHI